VPAVDIQSLLQRHLQSPTDDARLDLEVLLCHVLAKDRGFLRGWPEYRLDAAQLSRFEQLWARRLQGEPIAYLTGSKEFWSLELSLSSATLIPRPETEILVGAALEYCADAAIRVLDLGTGSGAVALALASERPLWQIDACDIDPDCVEVALRNAQKHRLDNVFISQSDWFDAVAGSYQLILSNPPYIDPRDPHLRQGDVRFEPRRALVAAHRGLAAICHIVHHAPLYLHAGGYLMVEHGFAQGPACADAFVAAGFRDVGCIQDLAGRDRVTLGRKA
jgi:release factor glutamine methyltransferase